MARINFEDSIFSDSRFINLAVKLGHADIALGVLVRSWILAQKWYLKSKDRRIPIEDWVKQGLPTAIIEVGLAESNGESVRVSGADKQFAWLLERREAGRSGGLKSAATRKARYGTSQPSQPETEKIEQQQVLSPPEAKLRETRRSASANPKQNEASLLSSHFSFLSSPNSLLTTHNSEEEDICRPRSTPPNLVELWNSNCGDLSRCKEMSAARKKKWDSHWKKKPDLPYWQSVIQRLAESDFCNGRNNQGWAASVDFLLQPDTHVKVTEGKYDNRKRAPLNADLAQLVREGKV